MSEFDLEQLVERLLDGATLTRAERAALERSPVHLGRARELRSAQAALERAADQERAALFREAEALTDWPGREQLQERLRALLAEPPVPRRRPWLLWSALLAVAAVLVGFLLVRRAAGPPDPWPAPLDLFVGSGSLRDLEPLGEVERLERFGWRYELAPGGRFELRIWDAAAPPSAEPLVRVELQRAEWSPGPELSLPAAIRWQVRAFGATSLEAAAEGEARRRQP